MRVKSSVPKSSAAPQRKAADRPREVATTVMEIFADLHLVDLKKASVSKKLGSSKITRIIHQTWKDEDSVPPQMAAFSAGWRKLHPDWEYRLWTDESIDAFVAKEFPQLYGIFESYPWQIQRVDFAVLHFEKFGGLFVDMDFEALRPFDAVIARSALDVHHRKSKQGGRSWSWAWPCWAHRTSYWSSRTSHMSTQQSSVASRFLATQSCTLALSTPCGSTFCCSGRGF